MLLREEIGYVGVSSDSRSSNNAIDILFFRLVMSVCSDFMAAHKIPLK